MVLTVQPPPPVESYNEVSGSKASLDTAVHGLHDLIFNIGLPKTKSAKMAAITTKDLHLVCKLAESACTLLQEHHSRLQLDNISKHMEAIRAQLDAPSTVQPLHKLTYTTTLSMGIRSPASVTAPPPMQSHPVRRYDVTLTQISRDNPVFTNLSNDELIAKILEAFQAASVCLEERAHTSDSDGYEAVDCLSPFIRAVGQHRSRDIWIAMDTRLGTTCL